MSFTESGEVPETISADCSGPACPVRGLGDGGQQASRRTPSCWQRSLSAGSSESAHIEIRHVANPAMRCKLRGGGRMELRSLQLSFHPWQCANVLECPAASVARGRGFPGGWHHDIWQVCSVTTTASTVAPSDNKGIGD